MKSILPLKYYEIDRFSGNNGNIECALHLIQGKGIFELRMVPFLASVVVTRLPITNSQQLRPVLPGSSRDSKIIRFLGNSFIRYDFGVLTAEMLSPSNKESLALQFVTDDEEGLIWLFEGPGKDKIHLSVKVRKYEPPHDKTNKLICAPSEDSDQPGHPPSLIRVFAVRMKKAWLLYS